jgi:ABC-type transport system involved in multi-copper enzyme maturation permease subunit
LLPSAELDWTPLLVMTGIAVVVSAFGWWRFSRRDIG